MKLHCIFQKVIRLEANGALILTLLALGTVSPGSARADTIIWTGVTNSFSSAANWNGTNTPPVSGDSLVFDEMGTGGTQLNNNLTNAGFQVAGITFNFGADPFVIGDGTMTPNAGNPFVLAGNVNNNGLALQTINTPFSITSVRTFNTTTGGGDITLGGNLTGAGGIALNGGGTLTLTGSNTYGGGTTITSGILQLGNGGASGSITGNVTNNDSVVFKRSDDYTFDGVISGTGEVKAETGTVRFSAAQTYTGFTTLTAASILVLPTSVDYGLSASSVVYFQDGGILDLSNRNQRVAGLIGGIGDVYSFGGGDANLTLDVPSGETPEFSGTLGSTFPNFSLTKSGNGTQVLNSDNTYTGGTTISAGTLQLGNGAVASGSVSGNVTNQGTLVFKRTDDFVFPGVISGNGTVKIDTGVLRFSAVQTYTGPTTVSAAGTLVLPDAVDFGLSPSSLVTVAGSLDLANRNQKFAGLAGGGTVYSFGGNSGSLTLDVASGPTQTFSGTLGGFVPDFSVTKAGNGTQIFSGSSTYTGGTTVSGGTLLVNNTTGSGLGSGSVTVASGATLGGSGAFTGSLDVSGTLAPGTSIEPLASGTLTFSGNSTFAYEVNSSAAPALAADLQIVGGDLNVGGVVDLTIADLASNPAPFALGTKLTLINYTGTWNSGVFSYGGSPIPDDTAFIAGLNTWILNYNDVSGGLNFASQYLPGSFVTLEAIPEPATWALIGLAALALSISYRRRGGRFQPPSHSQGV